MQFLFFLISWTNAIKMKNVANNTFFFSTNNFFVKCCTAISHKGISSFFFLEKKIKLTRGHTCDAFCWFSFPIDVKITSILLIYVKCLLLLTIKLHFFKCFTMLIFSSFFTHNVVWDVSTPSFYFHIYMSFWNKFFHFFKQQNVYLA